MQIRQALRLDRRIWSSDINSIANRLRFGKTNNPRLIRRRLFQESEDRPSIRLEIIDLPALSQRDPQDIFSS